jgi:Ca2+-binding EF-hand superfamily protein
MAQTQFRTNSGHINQIEMQTFMKEIKFTLTIQEANLILEALGQMPYIQVHQLVHKLQQQAEPQFNGSPIPATDKTTAQ